MAQQGFDPSFGLRGTCASDVSGFGGWPLAVFEGIDGRPTIVCSSKSQKQADRDDVVHGNRTQKPIFQTLRVVSFPPDGRPVPINSFVAPALAATDPKRTQIFGPDPSSDTEAIRAIVNEDRDRIAVLGFIIRANQPVPTLSIFTAGAIRTGVAPWALSNTIELTALAGISVFQYGMGWSGNDVLVAAAQFVAAGVEVLIFSSKTQQIARVDFPRPRLDISKNFNLSLRVGAVSFVKPSRLFVAMTWVGLDPNIGGLRLRDAIDQGRASLIGLRRTKTGYSIDANFGTRGIWVATRKDGEITTSDHLVIDSTGRPVIGGRAIKGGVSSLFAAAFDPSSGQVLWAGYPGAGLTARPDGMAAGLGGNVLVCGTTRDWDIAAPSDPGDGVAFRLLPSGQPDGGFGVNGVMRFRLHGGTHPTACAETGAGQPLIASLVPWGWEAAATCAQPCLSRLTAAGDLDPAFGSAGVCRHDALGSVDRIAVDAAGRVWSAGIAQISTGAGNSPLHVLTVARCSVDGELDAAFGSNGIATLQLPQWDNLDLTAIVPLADGRVVLNGTATLHAPPQTGGSWLLRLQSNGQLDTTFGGRQPSGFRFFGARDIVLLSELANGTLQGFEGVAAPNIVSVDSNGGQAAATALSKPLVNIPSVLEPNGDFFALMSGKVAAPFNEVGLIRFRAGVIDPNFGTGGVASTSTPGNPDPSYLNLASLGVDGNSDRFDLIDQTIELAEGTFLTLWTIGKVVNVTIFPPPNGTATANCLLLLAWAADGKPRNVASWMGPGKVIANPAAGPRAWIGWSYQCAVLQPDGSIIVGLAGDDTDAAPPFGKPPAVVSQSPYFCRLIPPNFDRDPAFGGGAGFLDRRAPGCDFIVPPPNPGLKPGMAENQRPVSARRIANDAVIAAIRCKHPSAALGNTELEIPNLPLDGSIGIARLT